VRTRFAPGKLLRRVAGTVPLAGGAPATGYEIRHGQPSRDGGEALIDDGSAEGEGCAVRAVLGTSWHGLLEGDEVRRGLLAWVAERRGRRWRPGTEPFAAVRERHLDRLGSLIEEHADVGALEALIEGGAPAGLPVVESGLVGRVP
jgi:adenosylcobyric acid synthase